MEDINLASAVNGAAEIEQDFPRSNGGGIAKVDGDGVGGHGIIGIAEVPGNVIHVAENVAAGAGSLAVP